MEYDKVLDEITEFIRDEVLLGDEKSELTPTTPLLEWGVLNSLNTARLLAHIRERWNVDIPPQYIVGRNFRNLENITTMVLEVGDFAG